MEGALLAGEEIFLQAGLLGNSGEYEIITLGAADVLFAAVWICQQVPFRDGSGSWFCVAAQPPRPGAEQEVRRSGRPLLRVEISLARPVGVDQRSGYFEGST
jgi:hypothetical protein